MAVMFLRTLTALSVLLAASSALAEPPKWPNEANAETCAESFPVRLADFRSAASQHQRYMAEYNRVMPWFDEHCRWLTELEIAIRKIDDPAAFVCDTQKGRPKGLTTQVALEHNVEVDLVIMVQFSHANTWCAEHDAGGRVSLALSQAKSEFENTEIKIEGMCFEVSSAKCDSARTALADARAQMAAHRASKDAAAAPTP